MAVSVQGVKMSSRRVGAVLKMAINKVKYGEYMISLLRCHPGREGGRKRERERGDARVRITMMWGVAGDSVQAGPIVVNRKLKMAIK